MYRRPGCISSTCLIVVVLAAMLFCGSVTAGGGAGSGSAPVPEKPKFGGRLRVAVIGEPPTLDWHWTTAASTMQIVYHVFETLFTLGKNYQPMPMLADAYTLLDNGKTYRIQLRKNVRFHNGKEMTSEDVVSSLQRWGKVATFGKELFSNVESVKATGPYEVEFRLLRPLGTFIARLARLGGAAAIYPKEVVEEAGSGQIKRFIGTGPYRFVERVPDRYVKVARFDSYASRNEEPDGWGGRKTAYLDEIMFIPVPDAAARVAGVLGGEFDFADQIPPDSYQDLKSSPGIQHYITPYSWLGPVLNTKQGVFKDKRLRQAYALALKVEPILQACYGEPAFYRIDPSLMPKETPWWCDAGAEFYNQGNVEKAKKLLAEAGYSGQPVRFLTTREYDWAYKSAVVIEQQLEAVGFNVELQVVDWATLVSRRGKPDLWEIHSNAHTAWGEPTLYSWLSADAMAWWANEQKEKLIEKLGAEASFEKRFAAWKELQQLIWEEAPVPKIGDFSVYRIGVAALRGVPDLREPFFWNAWLDR